MNVSFQPQIEAAARRHGLDPRFLEAVAAQETGGPGSNSGRNVVGDGGHGHGVFQIDDRYHAFARTSAAMDPAANAEYAAGMISDNIKRYGGDVHAALSAYNAGDPRATGTKTTWGDGKTLGYADSVMRHYQELCGGQPAASSPIESALADQPDAQDNVNALLNALQNLMSSSACSVLPPSFGQSQPGVDATGHSSDSALENYITGDDE